MQVAIVQDDFFNSHSSSWTQEWISHCEEVGVPYNVIDWRSHAAFATILESDVLLWHFSHYSLQEMQFAQSILYSAQMAGLSVFPSFEDAWHFDDKIAQAYALAAIEAPTPRNYVFYDEARFSTWIARREEFPVVAKLRQGSGSHNVKLIDGRKTAVAYANRMFRHGGISPRPDIGLKIRSNVLSSRGPKEVIRRAKRIPEYLHTLKQSRNMARERGYVYFQDFIPNHGYDLKVVVIGNKLSAIGRRSRPGEFRASGSGSLFYDANAINEEILETAFMIAERMNSQCLGLDFVVDAESGRAVVIEMSYGFSHEALAAAGGYWDRKGLWQDRPINAPREILQRQLDNVS